MDATSTRGAGDAGIQVIPVWDPLVRMIHWSLVAVIVLNGFVTDPENRLHEYVGYAALGLVVLRLVWGLIGPRHARFTAFPPNPVAALRHIRDTVSGRNLLHLSHNPLGALMVYNIWATVLVLCATGIMMGTIRFFGLDWVKEVHEVAFSWLMASVALHLIGVFAETWMSGVPLVRAMIDGRKRVPAGRETE
ncbi:cytochrome b/b6 domain-containing protein [Oricola sp.]|uniref:cytochrome b/b6 domain-containing protein n=1 Tax=Oricola sp. TaxID=1979950 RepID=UPI0025FDC616|nr:cytochrome b/b6 domain-containing protein [Oricola sp.]MCI5074425.1 cytochrome b/b6 domain-containing protein [Oricola sp.]